MPARPQGSPVFGSGHLNASEKGNRIARLFCEKCGTPLFAKNETHPEFLSVKIGSLDDPGFFRPQANPWTKSARPWHFLDAAVPQFERAWPISASVRHPSEPSRGSSFGPGLKASM
jgi:hypothetical protein